MGDGLMMKKLWIGTNNVYCLEHSCAAMASI